MTLILGMSKPEGIYMSTDYRITRYPDGALVDDASIKFLTVRYPPYEGGPTALIGYSGLAILPDKTPTGQWIRETLRGESEVFDVSMAHLRSRLNRDIARRRFPLQISVLVLQGERRFFGGFSNQKRTSTGGVAVESEFGYTMQELAAPHAFAMGSGAITVLTAAHRTLINQQLAVRPRSPRDHMGLLAAVNRRVASHDSTVSPFCHVSYVNADTTTSPESRVYTKPGEPPLPFEPAHLLFGIDLDFIWRDMMEQLRADSRGERGDESGPDLEKANESLRRRA